MSDAEALDRIRAELDAFADEHAEPGSDAAVRAMCEREGIDVEEFEQIAAESAGVFLRALPMVEACTTAFAQAFFMGIKWNQRKEEDEQKS